MDIAARIAQPAEGGQVLSSRALSGAARPLLKGRECPDLAPLVRITHGPYALTGVEEPVGICEGGEEGADYTAKSPQHPRTPSGGVSLDPGAKVGRYEVVRFLSVRRRAVPGARGGQVRVRCGDPGELSDSLVRGTARA